MNIISNLKNNTLSSKIQWDNDGNIAHVIINSMMVSITNKPHSFVTLRIEGVDIKTLVDANPSYDIDIAVKHLQDIVTNQIDKRRKDRFKKHILNVSNNARKLI